MNKPVLTLGAVAVLVMVLGRIHPVHAAQYTAFSLKVAQQRIEKAGVGDPETIGKGWRKAEPEVVSLGGINHVEGFVYDKATGDLIMVGENDVEDPEHRGGTRAADIR